MVWELVRTELVSGLKEGQKVKDEKLKQDHGKDEVAVDHALG